MPSVSLDSPLVRKSIDTIRLLAADAVEKANSGHPGTPMEAAPIAYLIYTRHLRHNPTNPDWAGRDRFVLSCGHASMLLYSMLHLCGYGLTLDDLKNFRQFGSKTPGHPEFGHTAGVETTTGPLGQGVATATGMAMGIRFLRNQIDSELFDSRVYALCSDGDLMEGVSGEAASLAGHLRLGNLINVYLDNRITIEGETDLAFTEKVAARYQAYGWDVQHVIGEDLAQVDAALERAKFTPQPTLIIARTHIGQGSPNKQDTPDAHGAPLGAEELALTKQAYGWDPQQSFVVPDDVASHMAECKERGAAMEQAWQDYLTSLQGNSAVQTWLQAKDGSLPEGWTDHAPRFSSADGAMATRQASGKTLNALASQLPFLLGGSADLAPSNNTHLKGFDSFTANRSGRNIHFGVREHAMAAILNGMALQPGLIPFGGTFFVFTDYMRPSMRLAAMMGLAPIYVLTHDSIGLGEDGPTHQPVEHLAALRCMPHMTVIRPGDANETSAAWCLAIANRRGPTALILTRQGLPVLDPEQFDTRNGVAKGAYVLAKEEGELQVLLLASGSEIHCTLDARAQLQKEGIGCRVVSMPCWELFEAQDQAYRDEVLPPSCTARVAVEAAGPFGWERYIGPRGIMVGMPGFGASAPAKQLMNHFGFTADNVAAQAKKLLAG